MKKQRILAAILILAVIFSTIGSNVTPVLAQGFSIRVMLEPSIEADFVYPFNDGLAAVRTLGFDGDFTLGYVNRYGQFIIPLRDYTHIPHWQTPQFSSGIVAVYSPDEEAVGFFDTGGAMVIPFMYDMTPGAFEFIDGLMAVSYEGLWGFIDTTGQEVIPFQFERAGSFSEGRAPVKQSGRWGFVNADGEMVIPFVLDHYEAETPSNLFINPGFSEALAPILLETLDGVRWGFLDISGNRIDSDLYLRVEGFSEGRALVMSLSEAENAIFGFINREGDEIIPPQFDYAHSFNEGLAAVRTGNTWGFIEHNGNVQVPIIYNQARSFSGTFAAVASGGPGTATWGFVDRWANEVVPLIYHEVRDFSEGLAAVRVGEGLDARWGFVDHNGNVIVPIEYLEAHCFSEGLAWVRGADGWGILQMHLEDGDAPDDEDQAPSRYIYQDTPDYMRFIPAPGSLDEIYDHATADEAIFRALRDFTPQQQQSGDAINHVTLFLENALRRGTSQDIPDGGILGVRTLQFSAYRAQAILDDTNNTISNEAVNLLRPVSLGINFISHNRNEISAAFPDDVAGIDFANVTVEGTFAAITLQRDYIPRDSYISVTRGQPVWAGDGAAPVDAANDANSSRFNVMEQLNSLRALFDDFSIDSVTSDPLGYLRLYWAVAAILLIILLWAVLALAGHRFRLWVVPTFVLFALAGNLWTLGWFEQVVPVRTMPAGYFYSMQISMSPRMSATVSVPLNGANPANLVLVNEDGEPQLTKHNPVTDTLDARIHNGGIFIVHATSDDITDLEGLSPQARHAIARLVSMGIMTATEGEFRPHSAITRSEFTTAVVLAADMLDVSAPNHFPDNVPGSLYYHAVASAANLNLVHGYEDGSFRGNWAITKNDLVFTAMGVITVRMGYSPPANADAVLSVFGDFDRLQPWTTPAIALATATDVLMHREDGLFAPDSVMTRGDAAIVVYRLFGRLW